MNLLDIGNNVRNFLRQKALDVGFKPLKDNSLGANLRGIGQAGQISTNFAQKQVNNFAQPAYNIPIAGGLVKGIINQPFNYASSGAQFLQNPNVKTGSSFLGQGLNTASMFVAPTGLSFKAGQRVLPQIPNMAKNSFLKIGLPAGAGGALDTYSKGGNAKDILGSFAFNTAVGGGAGIGFPLAGRGIKNTFNGLRPSPKPVLMPRNNPFIANLGIKDRPLEVNPNLPGRNYGTKPTPKKLMEGRDINLLDELFDKNIRKEIGRNSTTNQLAQLMDRYFTKAEIDKLPKNDNAWRKALAKRANQTESYFDNKARNTNQSFLKIGNPAEKQRGFVSSVKESKNVTKPTKNITIGGYTQKTNDSLMGEAKSLLNEGAKIDFSKVKNVDQKVAATIQEALNLDGAGKHDEAATLFNNLARYGTELGRGVQAFNMLDKMSPEAITKSAARTIQKYNETAIRKIPELTGPQQKLISGAVERIRGMKDGREKNLAINDLQNTINSFVPSTLVDKAITVWKAGLLTSLRTHERNLLGNTVMQASEAIKNPIAAGADALMSTFTGQRTKTATTRGLQDAFSKQTRQQFVDKARLGFDPSNDMAGFDVRKVNWNTKNPVEVVLKKYTNAVFNTLSASDTPFFNASFANSLYDQAGAIAKNSGKSGDKKFIESLVKSPTAEMLTQATKDAQYATFKDKNVLSGVAGNIKRKLAEQGGLKGEAGKIIGELTMPFTGVPSSVIAKTVAYSPLGLIKGAVTTGRVISGQVPELQRQASEEIARGVLGTGLFGLGSYLMSKGLMTGQPKDSKEADQWAIEGKQANSILIGGKWRGINSVGPQSLVLLAGSKYNEEMNDPEGGFGSFATKLGKDQLGQTFVQGMSAPINAITDPNRYGKSYVGNTVSSVVPNIVKDIAKSQDKYARETNTTIDYLKQSTPLLRNTLLPRRTNIGDVIPQEPTGAGAFLDIFNSKTPIKNKVVDELARLNNVGFEATPSKMKKDQTIQGVKKTLTPQELDTLEAQTGPVLNETLNRLVESEYYKNLDDEAKSKAIDKVVTDIRRKVKGSINLSGNTLGDINTEITQTKAPTVGQYEIFNPETNKIKTIDIETPIEKPVLTGNTALDKKLISKFNSKLTSRANDIVALYEDGQIDGKTAESELTKLTTLKLSTGKSKKGKKGKKITIKKIAGARKITNIKIGKSSSLKPIKIKKLKLKSAKKIKKVGNIKIANYKLPKIKIS